MCYYRDAASNLEELKTNLEDILYDLQKAKEILEDEIPTIRDYEEELEEIENHTCEYTQYHIEQLLRADDGAQEQNHAHLLKRLGEPQPICPWCKQTAGIVYRENEQYLLRCPCRVIYVEANSPAAAAKQLQLPGENQ